MTRWTILLIFERSRTRKIIEVGESFEVEPLDIIKITVNFVRANYGIEPFTSALNWSQPGYYPVF